MSRERLIKREERDIKREEARPERIPVSGNRDILTVKNKEAGFVYRWVLDTGNRLVKFRQGGWEVAPDNGLVVGDARIGTVSQEGSAVTASAGNGQVLVLMRIKEEFYNEDQDYKERNIQEMEGEIENLGGNASDGRYGKVRINQI